jgi:hypothetical protein
MSTLFEHCESAAMLHYAMLCYAVLYLFAVHILGRQQGWCSDQVQQHSVTAAVALALDPQTCMVHTVQFFDVCRSSWAALGAAAAAAVGSIRLATRPVDATAWPLVASHTNTLHN